MRTEFFGAVNMQDVLTSSFQDTGSQIAKAAIADIPPEEIVQAKIDSLKSQLTPDIQQTSEAQKKGTSKQNLTIGAGAAIAIVAGTAFFIFKKKHRRK